MKRKVKDNKETKHYYDQSYLSPTNPMKDNESKGDIMIKKMNITSDFFDNHLLLQLCSLLQEKGVDVIFLTETNVSWDNQHVIKKN